MGVDLVVILDPSGNLAERRFGVGHRVHAQIIPLEGLDEGLGHAVGLRAPDGREAGNEVEGRCEGLGLSGDIGAAIVGKMLDRPWSSDGPEAGLDGLQHEIANIRPADPRAAESGEGEDLAVEGVDDEGHADDFAIPAGELQSVGTPAQVGGLDHDLAVMDAPMTAANPGFQQQPIEIAILCFGNKMQIRIDRRHGIIRCRLVTHAAAHDGTRLREGLIDKADTASGVWADTAYRSEANEEFLRQVGLVSRIHRKKPAGRPMPPRTTRVDAKKSAVCAHVEHPFAVLMGSMRLMTRTIGLARASTTVTLAAIVFNMKRRVWLDAGLASA